MTELPARGVRTDVVFPGLIFRTSPVQKRNAIPREVPIAEHSTRYRVLRHTGPTTGLKRVVHEVPRRTEIKKKKQPGIYPGRVTIGGVTLLR